MHAGDLISNWINGREQPTVNGMVFQKVDPTNGKPLWDVSRSNLEDVRQAVNAARQAQPSWADVPPVKRGSILHEMALAMGKRQMEIARIVASETGKSLKDAVAETEGAISLGLFYASEGQRLYGRTTTSSIPQKYVMTVRQPVGVAGLITAANTPIANVAWKIFPALICGNAVVLKAAEDTPATAWIMGLIAHECGLPQGILNIIQGYGEEAGRPLVEHHDVDIISFTGSTAVGRFIHQTAGKRLAKVSLELGGKNPIVICDDADLGNANKWTVLSAFSNAGQRCASGSRIIIFNDIYAQFRDMLVRHTNELKIGPRDEDDFGPVINKKQLDHMLAVVDRAQKNGALILTGGTRLNDPDHANGFYMAPTLLENVKPRDEISTTELFGPIACLYRVNNFQEALTLANDSPYGLTACIHTRSLHRAMEFTKRVQSGVAIVNAGTYGSEPHMPFGGLKASGNGWREPGTEAIDIYSELKNIYINTDPAFL
ncbi:MAG: aldehyde dehydrogenase [Deltaproteobacteria bacterium]|nr:aldehyde dehydrogenase [Deltaproteobacteria bacterium]